MTEIITVNPTFINKSLQSATNRIMTIGKTVRKCAFETAYIMAKVDESECYKDDGFNSVHEWAMSTFGFKKSASYTLLRVGKEYTQAIMGDNGKVKSYSSNLVEPESEIDFTTSQIEKMLPLKREDVDELVGANVITPDMTCKDIAKVVKVRLHDYVDEEGHDNGGSETVAENSETVVDNTTCFNGSESEEISLSFVVDRELGKAVFVDSNGVAIRFELVHLDKFMELIRHTGEIIQ